MNRRELSRRQIQNFTRQWAKWPTALGIAVALACVIGGTACKSNRVTANVDITSFIPADQLTGSYQAPAGSPGLDLDLEPIAVDLQQATQNLANAEEMSLDVALRADNSSGAGAATVMIFFSETSAGAYADAPVATIDFALAPGQTSTAGSRVQADSRVLALFKTGQLWMGLRLHWAPSSADPLVGQYTITRIRARVVSHVGFV